MWKDSLSIGMELIDNQHKELFQKTQELLKEVHNMGVKYKEKCASTIRFLKNYAAKHFADEESYQLSVGYKDFESHKKQHDMFIKNISHHDEKMVWSNYAEKDVKEFTGMLVAWLLYHVAGVDQEIEIDSKQCGDSLYCHSEIVCLSVFNVLNKVAGLDFRLMKKVETHSESFEDSYAVEMILAGNLSGYVVVVYPRVLVDNMIHSMMGFVPEVIDELETSALFEISSIICGTICGQITKKRNITCEIQAPFLTKRSEIHPEERISIDTGKGIIEVDLTII